jgi:hypothetical protein
MSKEERSLRDIADAWRTDKKRTAVSRTYDVMVEGVGMVQVFSFLFLCSLLMSYWTSLCVLRRTCRQE